MSIPDVSIIIPTWNRATYLPRTIESIAGQTTSAKQEVIIADDASTDDTSEVVRQLRERYHSRLAIEYHLLPKGGVCVARNRALAVSQAPIIAFLDSDDVWDSNKLETQLQTLSDTHGVSHTNFRYINSAGEFTDAGPQRTSNPARGSCLSTLLDEDTVVFSSTVILRKIIDAAAEAEPHGLPFDANWTCGEDYDLLLRCARLTQFSYCETPLTQYRVHSAQTGMADLPRVFRYHCRVQISFAERWGTRCGFSSQQGRTAARNFLFSRANSLFWQREFTVMNQVCDVATELGLSDPPFDSLRRKSKYPRWLFRAKDALDKLFGKVHHR